MKTRIKKAQLSAFSVFCIFILLPVALQARSSGSAQDSDQQVKAENLETATVVSVQPHSEGRPVEWLNEGTLIPIYDGYPYYDITLQVGDKKYVVRYENMGGYYPTAWKPGSEVKVRVEHGRAYILRYDGVLVPTSILQTSST